MVDYPGRAAIPDIFAMDNFSLIYYNNALEKIKIKSGQTALDIKRHFDTKKLKYSKAIK